MEILINFTEIKRNFLKITILVKRKFWADFVEIAIDYTEIFERTSCKLGRNFRASLENFYENRKLLEKFRKNPIISYKRNR